MKTALPSFSLQFRPRPGHELPRSLCLRDKRRQILYCDRYFGSTGVNRLG